MSEGAWLAAYLKGCTRSGVRVVGGYLVTTELAPAIGVRVLLRPSAGPKMTFSINMAPYRGANVWLQSDASCLSMIRLR